MEADISQDGPFNTLCLSLIPMEPSLLSESLMEIEIEARTRANISPHCCGGGGAINNISGTISEEDTKGGTKSAV